MKNYRLENELGKIIESLVSKGYSIDKSPGVTDSLAIRKGEDSFGQLKLEKYCINLFIYDTLIPHHIGDDIFKSVRNYIQY